MSLKKADSNHIFEVKIKKRSTAQSTLKTIFQKTLKNLMN